MPIEKQSLALWFADYQLMKMKQQFHHLPILATVDLSRAAQRRACKAEDLPLTAMVIKAAGLLLQRYPEANQALIRSPWGNRILRFEGAHVIVPLYMQLEGQRLLSATVIRHADRLSLEEIQAAIKAAQNRPIAELPIARRLLRRSNNFFARLELRMIYFRAHRIPLPNPKTRGWHCG